MRRRHQITGFVCLVLAAFVAHESVKLKLYTPLGPGPGFFPLWLAVGFGALAVTLLVQTTLAPAPPPAEPLLGGRAAVLRLGAVLTALAGTALLLEPLGFRLTTLAAYLFLLRALGRPRLSVMLVIALAGSFGVYHVFVNLLHVALPVGRLGI